MGTTQCVGIDYRAAAATARNIQNKITLRQYNVLILMHGLFAEKSGCEK
jgi:hypothetical protein